MLLASLEKGGSATVTAIDAPRELKHRFSAFGLVKGATVTVEQRTLAKQTIEVRINHTRLAIRLCEAQKVSVQP